MKISVLLTYSLILFCLFSCNVPNAVKNEQLPDSTLIAIRDGFDTRIAEYFEEQKDIPLSKWKSSGWNKAQRHSYPLIEYATVNLCFQQNIDSANIALVEYADYFIYDPDKIQHRDHFHWHSEMALRLIEFFGTNGIKSAGLIKPETEDKIFEAVWLYAKRRQQDQVGANTKAEPDHKISNTWYIYESENHHSQSFTTLWHFSKLIKDRPDFKDRKYDDGRTAQQHFDSWNEYLKIYFTERAKKGIYVEIMSRDYNHKSVKGMFNVYDFTSDEELKRKAKNYIDLYFTYWGQEQIDGIAGGGKSRLYQDINQGTSEYGYLFFGVGEKPHFQSVLLSAMTTSYRPPLVVVDIVCDRVGRGIYEVKQRPLGLAADGEYEPPIYHMRTDYGGILRYSYCTPDFVMGTCMYEARPREDWTLISSQNRSHGVIFAGHENTAILPQCEKTSSNRSYNSQWSVQNKGTFICQKLKTNQRAGRSVVWFSEVGLSSPFVERDWIFAESEGAFAAVRIVDGGFTWAEKNKREKGKWLVCENEYSPVILEVDQKVNYNSFEEFRAKVIGNTMAFNNNILKYKSLYNDAFIFYSDYSKSSEINGETVNYVQGKAYDSPFLQADWNSGVVYIQKGNRELVLDFN